jgi:hypothetical protein
MAKYVLAYHGGEMPATAEAQANAMDMEAWGRWFGSLGSALVDGGNPVGATRTITASGSVSAGGGANALTGYTIISADSLDAAVKLAKGCPVLGAGASIEVCETVETM